MIFHRRNINLNKRQSAKQLESNNELIEFSKEEDDNNGVKALQDSNSNAFSNNQFNYLQHKRNNPEPPLQLHDSDINNPIIVNDLNNQIQDDEGEGEAKIIADLEEEEDNIELNDEPSSAFKGIIKDKINQIKEYKLNQRKCLLQEKEDGLYGKTTAPKDMLKDISQLINEDASRASNDNINNGNINEESDNEMMINKWEIEQYKSGVNTNKIKVDPEHKQIDEPKENIYDSFNKIRSKTENIDINSIVSSIQSKMMKEEGDLEYYRKKKEYYNEEITGIKNTESIIKDKIEFYIEQYYKLKKEFINLLQNEDNNNDADKDRDDEDNDDKYYLSN